MKSQRMWLAPGSIALAAVLAGGCSTLPTAPNVATGAGAPVASAIAPEAAQTPATGGATVTVQVQGQRGGTVSAGQFTVRIPPGAFPGQAMITVSQPDLADPRVDLSIWPAVKNGFRLPLTLVADLSTKNASQIAGSTVREFEPATGTWEPMARQTTDLSAKNVRAPLVHFSSYRVDIPVSGGISPIRVPGDRR